MARAAHTTAVSHGPYYHLLDLYVGSLHSGHPQLEQLDAPDSTDHFSLGFICSCLAILPLCHPCPKSAHWPVTLEVTIVSFLQSQTPGSTFYLLPDVHTSSWTPTPGPWDGRAM